jgi:hypothetical protein
LPQLCGDSLSFRIYIDESGTHGQQWLIIGMLFVPDHGSLHSLLCKAKEDVKYLNMSPKHNARYKETHLTKFRSPRDLELGKKWRDIFIQQNCYYRSIVIDWSSGMAVVLVIRLSPRRSNSGARTKNGQKCSCILN